MEETSDRRLDSRYQDGLRDGRIATLEKAVADLTSDVKVLNRAVWLAGGALMIVNLLSPVFDAYLESLL